MKYIQQEARAKTITAIRNELSDLSAAPLHERMRTAYEYHASHPELSARIICEALSIDQGTYRYFVKTGAIGNKCHSAHRQELLQRIHEIQKETPNASVPETVRQLKAQGCKCSHELVTELMDEAGYVTNVYSPTGIAEFWHQNEVSKKIVKITAKQM